MSNHELHIIDSCDSTNSALPRRAPHGYALMALEQTAGRGQRGNSWEAAPGLNITLSLMIRPEGIPAAAQFAVSEAVALGVADTLRDLGLQQVAVKWPNDIYVADRKICGILIENALSGSTIERSIAGIGLNVNQTEFISDAPNPVSIRQLTGREHDIRQVADAMIANILSRLERPGGNHADYRATLWRGTGQWPWRTPDGRTFTAAIADVLPTGHLLLTGHTDTPFAFKEVHPVL